VNIIEKQILNKFKNLILQRLEIYKMILFGSRARGDNEYYSDMDVAVILKDEFNEEIRDYISDCAWEAGFEDGIILTSIVFSQNEWENSPERSSLLVQALGKEGILI
jgi:predicted nucleotidyltransferase